jgi:hypothetical protein
MRLREVLSSRLRPRSRWEVVAHVAFSILAAAVVVAMPFIRHPHYEAGWMTLVFGSVMMAITWTVPSRDPLRYRLIGGLWLAVMGSGMLLVGLLRWVA